jgi:hypothetical protein
VSYTALAFASGLDFKRFFWMYKRAGLHVDGHSTGKRLLMISVENSDLAAARPFARDPML